LIINYYCIKKSQVASKTTDDTFEKQQSVNRRTSDWISQVTPQSTENTFRTASDVRHDIQVIPLPEQIIRDNDEKVRQGLINDNSVTCYINSALQVRYKF
jgi:hypothetical protein